MAEGSIFAGCLGCIGIGQAPAKGKASIRTVPRNFPGRAAGGKNEQVYLCSPETAVASAIMGVITDPRELPKIFKEKGKNIRYPKFEEATVSRIQSIIYPPISENEAKDVKLDLGTNIKPFPEFDPLPDQLQVKVVLTVGDNLSIDEIAPTGSEAIGYRSNVPKFSEFCFQYVDEKFQERTHQYKSEGVFTAIVAGENYGQGSSREHTAVAPRYLGVRLVLAKSFARIHYANLIQFGILALNLEGDKEQIKMVDELELSGLHKWLDSIIEDSKGERYDDHGTYTIKNKTQSKDIQVKHNYTPRSARMLRAGSNINYIKKDKLKK